jgi:release factor glutamine methyltransferase
MTSVAQTLAEGTAVLRTSSDAPRADALLLLERVLDRTRSWLLAYGEASVSAQAAREFAALCERRGSGMPAAYLLKSAGFYGHELFVDERVLIPRPETEHMVDEAISWLAESGDRVLDVGTGSGAIACAIAARTQGAVYATDISPAAIEVARENAQRLGVASRCHFYQGDLLEPVNTLRFNVIIANLPYVPTSDLPQSPSPVSFEPKLALDGGPDGLSLYRRLLKNLPPLLNPKALVLLEGAPPTMPGLLSLVRSSLPDFAISTHNDYAGLPRYVKAQRSA